MRVQWFCDRPNCDRPFRARFTHVGGRVEGLCASHYESERQKKKRLNVLECTYSGCDEPAITKPGVLMQLCPEHHRWMFHSDEHNPYYIPINDCACDLRAQSG